MASSSAPTITTTTLDVCVDEETTKAVLHTTAASSSDWDDSADNRPASTTAAATAAGQDDPEEGEVFDHPYSSPERHYSGDDRPAETVLSDEEKNEREEEKKAFKEAARNKAEERLVSEQVDRLIAVRRARMELNDKYYCCGKSYSVTDGYDGAMIHAASHYTIHVCVICGDWDPVAARLHERHRLRQFKASRAEVDEDHWAEAQKKFNWRFLNFPFPLSRDLQGGGQPGHPEVPTPYGTMKEQAKEVLNALNAADGIEKTPIEQRHKSHHVHQRLGPLRPKETRPSKKPASPAHQPPSSASPSRQHRPDNRQPAKRRPAANNTTKRPAPTDARPNRPAADRKPAFTVSKAPSPPSSDDSEPENVTTTTSSIPTVMAPPPPPRTLHVSLYRDEELAAISKILAAGRPFMQRRQESLLNQLHHTTSALAAIDCHQQMDRQTREQQLQSLRILAQMVDREKLKAEPIPKKKK